MAEQIVVPETGARLSPKAPPEIIAPAKRAGCAPKAIPADIKHSIPAAIVPNPVPEAVAKTALMLKRYDDKESPFGYP